jgi:hypothetical protein
MAQIKISQSRVRMTGLRVDENVLCLEIAVEHGLAVHVLESACELR